MKALKGIFTAAVLLMPLMMFAQGDLLGSWKSSIPMEDGTMGAIVLKIEADNSFSVDLGNDGTVDVKGRYELKDDVITIVEKESPFTECIGVKGVYKFSTDAASMTMVRIDDPCIGRAGESGTISWTRK